MTRLVAGALLAGALAACGSSPRDVAQEPHAEGHAERGDAGPGAAKPQGAEGYAYVARRSRGIVALAEARHLDEVEARQIIDRLADQLDACARTLEGRGELVSGAARIVAQAGPSGSSALNVRLAPGDAVAQNALLCLIAPVRAVVFPAATSGPPGVAIEATWEPLTGARADADAGG